MERARIPKMSLEEAKMLVDNKKTLYEAMQRNGWILPSIKSNCCTVEWMLGVREKEFWCPHVDNYVMRICARPPKKTQLLQILSDCIVKRGKAIDLGFTGGNPPEIPFILKLISTIDPDCEIFKKDYMPPREIKAVEQVIDNNDGFYSGLPQIDAKKKSKRSKLKHYQVAREEMHLNKLKEGREKIERYILQHEQQLQVSKKKKTIIYEDELEMMRQQIQEYQSLIQQINIQDQPQVKTGDNLIKEVQFTPQKKVTRTPSTSPHRRSTGSKS